jgi:hypothetical protein
MNTIIHSEQSTTSEDITAVLAEALESWNDLAASLTQSKEDLQLKVAEQVKLIRTRSSVEQRKVLAQEIQALEFEIQELSTLLPKQANRIANLQAQERGEDPIKFLWTHSCILNRIQKDWEVRFPVQARAMMCLLSQKCFQPLVRVVSKIQRNFWTILQKFYVHMDYLWMLTGPDSSLSASNRKRIRGLKKTLTQELPGKYSKKDLLNIVLTHFNKPLGYGNSGKHNLTKESLSKTMLAGFKNS